MESEKVPDSRGRQAIFPEGYPQPRAPLSPAVDVGDYVFVSGQVPLDPSLGRTITDQPFEAQAIRTLENVRAVLKSAGLDTEDVVRVGVYLSDLKHFAEFNEIYRRYFASEPLPARTTVQAQLIGNVMVEVDCIALRR